MSGALERLDGSVSLGGGELVSAFLEARSPATREAYAKDLRRFARFLRVAGPNEVAATLVAAGPGGANRLVLAWRSAMLGDGLAPRTVNRRLAAVRSLVKLARLVGLVTWTIDVEGVRTTAYRDTRGIGWEAYVERLSRAGVRDAAMIRLMGDRGLRRGEVLSLDLEHVGGGCAWVEVAGKGSGGERTRLTLAEPTAAALQAWIAERGMRAGPLFPGARGGRLHPNTLYQMVRRVMGCRPHALRHVAVTRALDVTGGDVRAVQKFSRHAKVETVLCYDDARTDLAGEVARAVVGEEGAP